jgi:hypothetical protein
MMLPKLATIFMRNGVSTDNFAHLALCPTKQSEERGLSPVR